MHLFFLWGFFANLLEAFFDIFAILGLHFAPARLLVALKPFLVVLALPRAVFLARVALDEARVLGRHARRVLGVLARAL